MKTPRLILALPQINTFPKYRLYYFSFILSCCAALAAASFWLVPFSEQFFNGSGFAFDLITLLIVLFMLWTVQCAHMQMQTYWILSTGFGLWLLAATLDVLDELLWQPVWLGIYFEDSFRALGMILFATGTLQTMYYLCDLYNLVKQQSASDELTSLPNRRQFRQKLDQIGAGCFSIALIDLDHFKKINDEFGHDTGDQVLIRFAALLQSLTPEGALAARLGGEEFGWLFYDEQLQVDELLQQLLQQSRTIRPDNQRLLTISIGAGKRTPGEAPEHLMHRVDQSLYKAKNSGRDQIQWSE
jgi:diguanylate cyclase (GGDEF)-like protein